MKVDISDCSDKSGKSFSAEASPAAARKLVRWRRDTDERAAQAFYEQRRKCRSLYALGDEHPVAERRREENNLPSLSNESSLASEF
jgi:hypothetical protein|nr:hypothetical protein [Neorhizobium tomejilense]